MAGITSLLDIAKSALLAQQSGLSVTSHNIANANTPGYSKQELQLVSRPGVGNLSNITGRGVDSNEVRQRQASFADTRLRQEASQLGQWEAAMTTLEQIENLFVGSGESDLQALINNFFNAWEDLSGNPESLEFRTQLLQRSTAMTGKFHELANSLSDIRDHVNAEIQTGVVEVNRLVQEIREINGSIQSAEANGNHANDLRDQRRQLVETLGSLMDIEVHETAHSGIQISHQGHLLLDNNQAVELVAQTTAQEEGQTTQVFINGTPIDIKGGSLGGFMQVREQNLDSYASQLDDIAAQLVTTVNEQHRQGFDQSGTTGTDFFISHFTEAANIAVSTELLQNPDKIAAAGGSHNYTDDVHTSNGPGDNSVARQIANLSESPVLKNHTATIAQAYTSLYADVGFDTIEAKQSKENHELLSDQIRNYRDSQVGVSIDEELADMMKFQNSYMAATRLITVANSMMQTLIDILK